MEINPMSLFDKEQSGDVDKPNENYSYCYLD